MSCIHGDNEGALQAEIAIINNELVYKITIAYNAADDQRGNWQRS